jgi:group I intron endonuclease
MIIYKITNTVNGKIYIGQTTRRLKTRWNGHISRSYSKSGSPLHAAIKKYKKENFTIEIIKKCSSREELNEEEIRLIQEHNSLAPNGYNIMKGGSYNITKKEKKKQTVEHTQKIREKFLLRKEEMRELSSKEWVAVSPEQQIFQIKNLEEFCRNHSLQPSCMIRVAKGSSKQHKKWLCYYKEEFADKYKPLEIKLFRLLDKEGNVHEFENPCLYADKLGVDRSWFNKVCTGKAKSYKGFTLP